MADIISDILTNETVQAALAGGEKFTVTVTKLLTADEALAAMAEMTGEDDDEMREFGFEDEADEE